MADQAAKLATEVSVSTQQLSLFPVIKKLISMLKSTNANSNDSMQQVWTLALRSLRTVEVSQLVEAHVLEDMIDAFLRSDKNTQQSTYTQILRISEQIATTDSNGRFLCKLLNQTLATNVKSDDLVIIGICQGWLDILTIGHISSNTKSPKAEYRLGESTIYATLEA